MRRDLMHRTKQKQQRVAVRTRKRAFHFWSPGGVQRRPHRTASAAACCGRRLRQWPAGRRRCCCCV